jgi:glycosyltransferase involved in cell wall biosynthesis
MRGARSFAACDCFLFLHRTEEFGLAMAEAMAFGRPVVATAYGGNLEYMDDETALLVRCDLTDAPASTARYWSGSRWAVPDPDDAAQALRTVFESPDTPGS